MAIFFFDSSSVAKRYVKEQGSEWIKTIIDPGTNNELYLSMITGVEMISAIIRRRHIGSLEPKAASKAIEEFQDDWQYLYTHIAIDEQMVDRGMKLAEVHELRAYDAMQLSAAIALEKRYQTLRLAVSFVSADDELNAAAREEGLKVENPNSHL